MGGNDDDSNKRELVIDNELCYATTAMHSMKTDDILRMCVAFYKSGDILKA